MVTCTWPQERSATRHAGPGRGSGEQAGRVLDPAGHGGHTNSAWTRRHSTWHQALESQLPDSSGVKMIQYFLVLVCSCPPSRPADIPAGGEGLRAVWKGSSDDYFIAEDLGSGGGSNCCSNYTWPCSVFPSEASGVSVG